MRRIDHANYLAANVRACSPFLAEQLRGLPAEQIMLDNGDVAAIWYAVLAPDGELVTWTQAERAKGQA